MKIDDRTRLIDCFFLFLINLLFLCPMRNFILLFVVFHLFQSNAQTTLTNEDIWFKGTYNAKMPPGFNFMNDGSSYCQLDENADKTKSCNKYDIKTGQKISNIFQTDKILVDNKPIIIESYKFSSDENLVLITNGYEQVYRHSGKSMTYLYNIKENKTTPISNKKIMYATLNPNGNMVAYVSDNNLYIYDVVKNKETQITKDGMKNKIINGAVDWVYEEEFSMSKGFEWSPYGDYIAFYRFDESKVPEFSMDIYGKLYPSKETWKYPKAGETNSTVDVYIYNIKKKKSKKCETGSENDQYLPRIKWVNGNYLSIQRLNRLQNKIEVLFANASDGKTAVFYTEENKYYIEINDLEFKYNTYKMGDVVEMNYLSEKSGRYQLYSLTKKISLGSLQFSNEKEIALTKAENEIDQYYGKKGDLIYFSSGYSNPSERQLYSINVSNGNITAISKENGWHSISFSPSFEYFVDNYSTLGAPPTSLIKNQNGDIVRTLETNKTLQDKLNLLNLGKIEFGKFTSSEGVELDYWKITPPNFDSSKKYPVLFFVYGGPGYQTVKNAWGGGNYLWHQQLAQKGYIVISVDNRGSGGRGEEFKKMTYLNLGMYETQDYIEAAKHFGAKSYVDKSRIGIWGWSYGGFMASNCITKGADYFKTAIAVAPVTNWRYYDNIYTERYMRTPKENANGYDANSPLTHVSKIKGNYLIIHGTADDNVHFQNAVEMVLAMNNANINYDAEYYPNKNHGIYGGKTRWHLYNKMTNYITEKL